MTQMRLCSDFPDPAKQKLLGAVGLAAKARGLVAGSAPCVDKMRADKGYLLVAAEDISENTKKRLIGTASFHHIPYLIPGVSKKMLAHAAGRKSDAAAVLFTDAGFVKIIEKLVTAIHTTNTEVLN